MTAHVGVAPLTVVRLGPGQRTNVPAGALVPDGADPDDVARLVEEGYLAAVDRDDVGALDVTAEAQETGTAELLKGKVGEILDKVGDDAELAAELLTLETGEGGQNRATLVKGLREAIEAGDS